jgi:hypothetical protein
MNVLFSLINFSEGRGMKRKKKKEEGQIKVVVGLAILTIIALTFSLCFVASKYSAELVLRSTSIQELEEENQILLEKSVNLDFEVWRAHLSVLAISMRVLHDKESYSQTRVMIWRRLCVSYAWVVKNDTQYSWDNKYVPITA